VLNLFLKKVFFSGSQPLLFVPLRLVAGDFGSMVNERVGASDWESGKELGDTWASRNAFSYGRGSERGTARPEVLQVRRPYPITPPHHYTILKQYI
jgi:hypothetical protein